MTPNEHKVTEQIVQGDCLEMLKTIPDSSVDMCVTSPPYYGLRDYGVDGQIGLEETPKQYIDKLVKVFSEVRRVLKEDGTLWLNIGDSYAAQRWGSHQPAETLAGGQHGFTSDGSTVNRGRSAEYNPTRNASAIGLKHKDLIGIPWMLAFALREDGWYLRQDIIWHKPNPMPESVRDRCTKSHEYLFLLSKNQRYYFDYKAIQTESKDVSIKRAAYGLKTKAPQGTAEHVDVELMGERFVPPSANKRDVWSIPCSNVKEAHFATFPEALVEPCILAGSKPGGGHTRSFLWKRNYRKSGCKTWTRIYRN